jgi:hypothetical protein
MGAPGAGSETTCLAGQLIFHFEECYRLTPLIARRRDVGAGAAGRGPGGKICIVSCGALGSVIAAHLVPLEDVEVYVYEVSEPQRRAIQQHGVRISGAAEFTVKVNAASNPHDIPRCQFGIFATKSQHTRAAAEQTARISMIRAPSVRYRTGLAMKKSWLSMTNLSFAGPPPRPRT